MSVCTEECRTQNEFSRIFHFTGLLHDDCLYEHPDVAEAVHRLPQKIKDERNFRIERAIHASMLHEYLPKDQWTKYEEDVRYLEPYIEDVRREHQEKFDYENNK